MIKNKPIVFDSLKMINEKKVEYWSARALAKELGYSEYRHFIPVIKRAEESCQNSGQCWCERCCFR